MNSDDSFSEKIGEGLVRIGAISQAQVQTVLQYQDEGDTRLFGEIAVDLGFIDIQAVIDYLKSTNKGTFDARPS